MCRSLRKYVYEKPIELSKNIIRKMPDVIKYMPNDRKTIYYGLHGYIIPFIISAAIHALLILLLIFLSYGYYQVKKINSIRESAPVAGINSIILLDENRIEQVPDQGIKKMYNGNRTGLNGEAARELQEFDKFGISTGRDDFLSAARLNNFTKDLNSTPVKKRESGISFSTGFDRKLKSDFQESFETVCEIINLPKKNHVSLKVKLHSFTSAVMEYLNGKMAVRTWRTLWLVKKPATTEDKKKVILLLCNLYNLIIFNADTEHEYMRESIECILRSIPDELKIHATCIRGWD